MEETRKTKFCSNCKRDQASNIHQVFCAKPRIILCPFKRCEKPIDLKRIKEHLNDHALVTCACCGKCLEERLLSVHKDVCSRRPLTCSYCDTKFPYDEMEEHQYACRSRTEKCPYCQNYVMLKDYETHIQEYQKRYFRCLECNNDVSWVEVNIHYATCYDTNNDEKSSAYCEEISNENKVTSRKPKIKNLESIKLKEIDALLEDLARLFHERQDSDLSIIVKGKQFHAHRIILKCRSPIFDRMLTHDMVEKEKGVVNVTDCNPDAFQDFLVYLYTGKLEQISSDYVHDLYYIGNKYEVKKLADACVNFMIQGFTVETFCDYLRVGLQHNEMILVESAIDFFRKNFKILYRSEQWKQFLLENPVEALEVSRKALE